MCSQKFAMKLKAADDEGGLYFKALNLFQRQFELDTQRRGF
jgi:hypothetical protein